MHRHLHIPERFFHKLPESKSRGEYHGIDSAEEFSISVQVPDADIASSAGHCKEFLLQRSSLRVADCCVLNVLDWSEFRGGFQNKVLRSTGAVLPGAAQDVPKIGRHVRSGISENLPDSANAMPVRCIRLSDLRRRHRFRSSS